MRFGAVALHAVVDPVPAAMLVAAQFPEVAEAPLVPAGVPAVTALVVADEPVNTWAGTVPALPANVGGFAGHERAPSVKPPPDIAPSVNDPPLIAPSVKAPSVLLPEGVPPLVPLVV